MLWNSLCPPAQGVRLAMVSVPCVLFCLAVTHLFLPSLALSPDQHHHTAAFSALARVFAALWPARQGWTGLDTQQDTAGGHHQHRALSSLSPSARPPEQQTF